MASLNQVHLIGRVGKDPETRQFDNGNKICTFSLATSEVYTNGQGERKENTEWHSIVLNNKLADLSQYIRKGSQVYVGGKIRTRKWTDNQGNDRYQTEVVGTTVQLLDPKPQQDRQPRQQAPQQAYGSGGYQNPPEQRQQYQRTGDTQYPQYAPKQQDDLPF